MYINRIYIYIKDMQENENLYIYKIEFYKKETICIFIHFI